MVIAANVLHATRDIDATLANIRVLCRKGGVVLINEATARPFPPISGFANVLAQLPRGLVVALDQVRQQKEAAA